MRLPAPRWRPATLRRLHPTLRPPDRLYRHAKGGCAYCRLATKRADRMALRSALSHHPRARCETEEPETMTDASVPAPATPTFNRAEHCRRIGAHGGAVTVA